MGHHIMIVKAYAKTEEAARHYVLNALEETIGANWDYVSEDLALITKDQLQTEYQVASFKELEKVHEKNRYLRLKEMQDELKDTIKVKLAEKCLRKKDMALYINDTDLSHVIEELAKDEQDKLIPDNFQDLLKLYAELFADLAKDKTSLTSYYMRKISDLQDCIDCPLTLEYTLHSTDNFFAEIPADNEKGLKAFYFLTDRHY